jgi:hypothetical protein
MMRAGYVLLGGVDLWVGRNVEIEQEVDRRRGAEVVRSCELATMVIERIERVQ